MSREGVPAGSAMIGGRSAVCVLLVRAARLDLGGLLPMVDRSARDCQQYIVEE